MLLDDAECPRLPLGYMESCRPHLDCPAAARPAALAPFIFYDTETQ
jgi:hypothetical protein